MLEGACHCGAVRWQYDAVPEGATACNCTVCRRYGVLWIYGHEGENVRVSGETRSYRRGTAIDFHFCGEGRVFVAGAGCGIPIDHFDGLDKFDDLPRDGKRVRDYWF